MSEIRFRTISIAEAKRWAQDVDHFTDDEFSLQVEHWKKHELDLPDPSYAELRSIGLEAFDMEKFLILAQFEPTVEGLSIDEMVDVLAGCGFSRAELNNALLGLGYPSGNSARCKCYSLRGLTKYPVDDSFPHISSDSFAGGALPLGVTSISYGISLDGVPGESMMELVHCVDGEVE